MTSCGWERKKIFKLWSKAIWLNLLIGGLASGLLVLVGISLNADIRGALNLLPGLTINWMAKPGVLAAVAAVLAKYDISIEALIQKSVLDSTHAEIVILTHSTIEKNIKAAIAEIEAQETVAAPVVMIRMESLHG